MDYQALMDAACLLSRADFVHIYGRGESQIVAEDFHYKLLRIGMRSTMEPQNGFQEAKCLQPSVRISQAALVVSHYCNSQHIHYVVDELMSSKIPFVLITAAENPFPYDTFAQVTMRVTSTESRFKSIYEGAKDLVAMLSRDAMTEMMVQQAVNAINAVSATLEKLKTDMLNLASQLPEFPVVMDMHGVGDSLGPQLMAEIGDVTRFTHRSSVTSFAGVDPGANQSGDHQSKSVYFQERPA